MARLKFQENLSAEAMGELMAEIKQLDAAYDDALEHASSLLKDGEPDDDCGEPDDEYDEYDEYDGPDFRVHPGWLGDV
jgi:hypothetical protein